MSSATDYSFLGFKKQFFLTVTSEKPMSILLLADDNQVLVRFTTRILESSIPHINVYSCYTYADARKLAKLHRPDLLILDRNLPDGDGYELIKELTDVLNKPKAIMLTAGSLADTQAARQPGRAYAVLKKPFEASELISTVKRALGANYENDSFDPQTDPDIQGLTNPRAFVLDRHLVVNRLSGLMAGLRAFGADLRAKAHQPNAVLRLVDEHEDRLVRIVQELSELLTKHSS